MTDKQAVGFFGNWAKWHMEQKEKEDWEKKKTHYYLVLRIYYGGYSALNVRYIAREWYDTESDCSWHVPGTINEND